MRVPVFLLVVGDLGVRKYNGMTALSLTFIMEEDIDCLLSESGNGMADILPSRKSTFVLDISRYKLSLNLPKSAAC
jgi:hypothetical protein